MFAAGMAVTGMAHQVGWIIAGPPREFVRNGNNALNTLVTILLDQRVFRGDNDRTRGRKHEYWRADVAGLYVPRSDGAPGLDRPMDPLDLSIAMADDRSRTDLSPYALRNRLPLAKSGYYFRALRFGDDADDQRSPDHFAVCTFPTSVSAGMVMFIMSDRGMIYQCVFYGRPPDFFPNDPEKSGWAPIQW